MTRTRKGYTRNTVQRIADEINCYYADHEDENVEDVNVYDYIPTKYWESDEVLENLYDEIVAWLGL